MTRRRFFLIAAIVGWFAHDGVHAQVHMSAGSTAFTDSRGVAWTPNTCSGWTAFANPGSFPSPIYNAPAFTARAGVPINCNFSLPTGVYRVLIHLIEAVKSFNAPQKRVFDIFVNDDPALTGVDIFARAGGVEFPVDVVAIAEPVNGVLKVSFGQQKSSALFAGIEVLRVIPSADIIDFETPTGAKDGSNVVFNLTHQPVPVTSLHVFVNGLHLSASGFSNTGNTLTFITPPAATDVISVTYWYQP